LWPSKIAKSREIPTKFDLIAVQGQPRSSILVSVESPGAKVTMGQETIDWISCSIWKETSNQYALSSTVSGGANRSALWLMWVQRVRSSTVFD